MGNECQALAYRRIHKALGNARRQKRLSPAPANYLEDKCTKDWSRCQIFTFSALLARPLPFCAACVRWREGKVLHVADNAATVWKAY